MSRMSVVILLVGLAAAAALVAPVAASAGTGFDRFFTPEQLRVDLYHTGAGKTEVFAIDEVIKEPAWGGNRINLIDTLNLGQYLMRVFDLATNQMIYSRGFSSIFEEWNTTNEALAGVPRTFQESLIMPFPRGKIEVRIEERDRVNVFRPLWDTVIDPADYHVRTERRDRDLKVVNIIDNGPPERKVDIVVLGDGYARDQMHKLEGDTKRLVGVLFDSEPFKSRKGDFNVKLVEAVSADSGADEPREHKWRDTALGFTFNFFDIQRYMLSLSNKAMRDMAGRVPYDNIAVIVNSDRYGGGGIFNLYSNGSADNQYSAYVFSHEFGHAFAGLGDEYFQSEVAYNDMYPKGMEPWEPNITALADTANVKWKALIKPGTPIPTPDDSLHNGIVGCFEGAGYAAKGLYRPTRDCRMYVKALSPFCPVCRAAIARVIDFDTR
jgi:hypothetical protein